MRLKSPITGTVDEPDEAGREAAWVLSPRTVVSEATEIVPTIAGSPSDEAPRRSSGLAMGFPVESNPPPTWFDVTVVVGVVDPARQGAAKVRLARMARVPASANDGLVIEEIL
jgi:hypothetical protein